MEIQVTMTSEIQFACRNSMNVSQSFEQIETLSPSAAWKRTTELAFNSHSQISFSVTRNPSASLAFFISLSLFFFIK